MKNEGKEKTVSYKEAENYHKKLGYEIVEGPVHPSSKKDKKRLVCTVCTDNDSYQIMVEGRIRSGRSLKIRTKKFKQPNEISIKDAVQKWNVAAYKSDNPIAKPEKFNIKNRKKYNVAKKNTRKSFSKKQELERFDLATRMRSFVEFKRCRGPQYYVEDFGYDVLRGFPYKPSINGKRALVYTIENQNNQIRIKIEGETISGKKVKIRTREYDSFKDDYLIGAISKWSYAAHKTELEIFQGLFDDANQIK